MKKLLAIVLALMLTLSAAAAVAEGVTLNVAWWGGQSRIDAFEGALNQYATEKGVAIETQTNGFSDHITSMATAGTSGDLPEMFMLQQAYMGNFIEGGMLVDLYPYVESGALDLSKIPQAVIDTGTFDGKLYGICAGVNAPALIYNKTLLDANGITVKDNMTIDEFCRLSADIFAKTGVKTYISNWTAYVEYLARTFDCQLGVGGKLGVPSAAELLPYFALIERGRQEGWLIDYSVISNAEATEEQPMVSGAEPAFSSWCAFWYSNQIASLQSAAPEGVELAMTTWPSDNTTKSNYLRQAMCWCLSAQSDKVEDAVALLNWWTNTADAQQFILGEPGVPANSEVAAAITDKLPEVTQKAFDYIVDVVTPNCSSANQLASAGYTELAVLIEELNEQVYTGLISANDAAQKLFDDGAAIMASYK